MIKNLIITIAAVFLMSPTAVFGQTVLTSSNPPVKPGGTPPQSAAPSTEQPPAPEGLTLGKVIYPDLHQPGRIDRDSGLVQRAWNNASSNAGVADYTLCGACVYRVRVREMMVTTIVLPENHAIEQIDVGDSVGYDVAPRGDNIIAVRPKAFGTDTNMNVYTSKGVMSFYIRAEGFDSAYVPDLLVRIADPQHQPIVPLQKAAEAEPKTQPSLLDTPLLKDEANIKPPVNTGISADIEFDPAKLRGWSDYTLSGDDSLRPETVFRDDYFTYIHFGDRWKDIELPVAFVVINDIDETVNTRVQGQTLIVESTAALISLKSGEDFLCITYEGEQS